MLEAGGEIAMTTALHWVRDHDDRLSFVLLYIGGAIALSVWLNLFWVAMLMLGHFALEIFRGHLLKAERPIFHALWEVKLDIGLLLFALVVALYADHVLALLGLGQAARAGQAARGLQAVAKFGIVERALRILVLTMDDIARLVQAVIKFRKKDGRSRDRSCKLRSTKRCFRVDGGFGHDGCAKLNLRRRVPVVHPVVTISDGCGNRRSRLAVGGRA
jgi:hypothetical protein